MVRVDLPPERFPESEPGVIMVYFSPLPSPRGRVLMVAGLEVVFGSEWTKNRPYTAALLAGCGRVNTARSDGVPRESLEHRCVCTATPPKLVPRQPTTIFFHSRMQ